VVVVVCVMAAEADGDALSAHVSADADDAPSVASVRPYYRETFECFTLDDAVKLSVEGTAALGIGRDGFTYGETALSSVWRILDAIDLRAYSCVCQSNAENTDLTRCPHCGQRPAGAVVADLGSGLGNVVVGVALLSASGGLRGRVAAVHGVELLPTLHDAAAIAVAKMGTVLTAAALQKTAPCCLLHCVDLEAFDLEQVDIVYMASTVFEPPLMERFAARAAAALPPGARVITLATPLEHPDFAPERVVACRNSWGHEDAYINVRRPRAEPPQLPPAATLGLGSVTGQTGVKNET